MNQHCYFVNTKGFDCILHIVVENSVSMCHQKLFFMTNAITKKLILHLLMLKHIRLTACRRMLCKMFQHVLPLPHIAKKLKNSIVKGSRLTMTMSQLPKMFGPNHQTHPVDNGLFLPSAVVALTPKYPMQEESGKISPERKLERWGS